MESMVRVRIGQIQRDPRILGGEPTIVRTRVPVASIVLLDRFEHGDTDAILAAFPTVSRDQVAAAFAYYAQHRDEIDRFIAEDQNSSLELVDEARPA